MQVFFVQATPSQIPKPMTCCRIKCFFMIWFLFWLDKAKAKSNAMVDPLKMEFGNHISLQGICASVFLAGDTVSSPKTNDSLQNQVHFCDLVSVSAEEGGAKPNS